MAGHSKFKNIMHRKGRADGARSKLFSKLSREITVAAKMGLPDPSMNARLRLAVNNAKAESLPKDVIDRAIKKASGGDAESYDEIRYEGFGPGGVGVIVEVLTDNRNRSAANVRSTFSKCGGNLGETGSVSFMWDRVGQIVYAVAAGSEDKVMEAAIEAGAEDVVTNDDGSIEVMCAPPDFVAVKDGLEKVGLKAEIADITMKPANEVELAGDDAVKMQKLLDALESLDDVQDVYTTAVIDD